MARTTISLDTETRDRLARVAGRRSMDETLRELLWEHELAQSLAAFDADPQAAAEYRAEAQELAEATVADGLAELVK